MANKCMACPNVIGEGEQLFCTGCQGSYHYACLGITVEYFNEIILDRKKGWLCQSCNNVSRRRRGDDTPVRKHFERSPSSEADMSICDEDSSRLNYGQDYSTINQSHVDTCAQSKGNGSSELSLDALSKLLDTKLAGVKSEIRSIDSKLNTTKDEIFKKIKKEFNDTISRLEKDFTATTDLLSNQIKDTKSDLLTVQNKLKELEMENSRLSSELSAFKNKSKGGPDTEELKTLIDQINLEMNEKDQALLLNDLEITGIPEQAGESPLHIVHAVSAKIGITLDERDIVSVERTGPPRTNNTRQTPRPLVLRLARRSVRDNVLRSARVRRNLDTSAMGLGEQNPCRIYINERLTKNNRKLFWQARQAGSAAGWRFVWTREGGIYAKKTDSGDSKTVRIRMEKEIQLVFGMDTNNASDR